MPFSIASPTLQEKQEFTARRLTRGDLPEVWELLQVINRVDDNDYYEAVHDLERQYEDPRSNPITDARIFRNLAGKLVAFARVFAMPKPTNENIAFLSCEVAPEARAQGLEQECIDWMEERATERLAEIAQAEDADALPRAMRVDYPKDSAFLAIYRARGFEHVRSSYNMQRDLDEPIPPSPLPPNLTLHTLEPEMDDAVRETFNESFRDHWGHEDASPEVWQTSVADVSDLRRDLSLVVKDGDETVAFCINFENTADNERRGIRRGWVGILGTRRTWRKRGIASALLAESMRRFREAEFDWLGIGVDTENLSGALHLYESMGFKPYKTRVMLEKKVAGSR